MSVRVGVIVFALVALGLLQAVRAGRGTSARPELVWGRHNGALDGGVHRPRAAAINAAGQILLVDFTARLQVFDEDGHYVGPTWTPPDFRNGRPSGLGVDRAGNWLVADSHYHCVRVYDRRGNLLNTLGGTSPGGGAAPGEWGYVSDIVQDDDGSYFVSEFGQSDRITKLDAEGKFLTCFGRNGQAEGEFNRVRALALGPDGLLYVADACNHRVQAFTRQGEFVRAFGSPGAGPGELSYPYDLAFHPDGNLYVVERGNRRVQKFRPTGESLGTWGTPGSAPGQLAEPWALVIDRRGRLHVIDTENHRVQRVNF